MTEFYNAIHFGDCRDSLRAMAAAGVVVQTCVTSPPYFGLRDYGHDGQIGLEETPEQFIAELVEVFRCVRDVLADDGTLWVNIGDTYAANRGAQPAPTNTRNKTGHIGGAEVPAGLKSKDLIGIPWMLAFALRADGWYLRQDIIWHKPNPMPESVTDRCTKAHEYLFLLSKGPRYFYDSEAVAEEVADTSVARWAQPTLAQQAGSARVPGKTNGNMKAVGGPVRAQARRAVELARDAGLSDAHIAAIRACGITDTGKARETQDGTGRNDPQVQKLADEAKAALGGYYREFLIAPQRNRRSVWSIATRPYKGAHFATFPPALVEPCILAGSRVNDVVLDPFVGSGTTAAVAIEHARQFIGCELNPEYKPLQDERIAAAHALVAEQEEARARAAAQLSLFTEAA
jgi:DNA modification methylase